MDYTVFEDIVGLVVACGLILAEILLLTISLIKEQYFWGAIIFFVTAFTFAFVLKRIVMVGCKKFDQDTVSETIQSGMQNLEMEVDVESPLMLISEGPKATDLGISLEEAKVLYARLTEFQRIQEAFSTGLSKKSDKELDVIMARLFEYIKNEDRESERWRWTVHG